MKRKKPQKHINNQVQMLRHRHEYLPIICGPGETTLGLEPAKHGRSRAWVSYSDSGPFVLELRTVIHLLINTYSEKETKGSSLPLGRAILLLMNTLH